MEIRFPVPVPFPDIVFAQIRLALLSYLAMKKASSELPDEISCSPPFISMFKFPVKAPVMAKLPSFGFTAILLMTGSIPEVVPFSQRGFPVASYLAMKKSL